MRPDFLVLGLGNPGPEYDGTRHNLGFLVIDALAASEGETLREGPGPSHVCGYSVGRMRGILAKPMTLMNRSGSAARALVDRLEGPDLESILVVTDDLDLPLGRLRFRRSGGDGGHNGLRSVMGELGSGGFPRLRLGIGRPEEEAGRDAIDHVLAPFLDEERGAVTGVVERAVEGVRLFVAEGIDAAMNRFNAP